MILDTNALSAAANDDPAVIALLVRADEMAIPVIVLGEYRHGIAQSRNRASYKNLQPHLHLRNPLVILQHKAARRCHFPTVALQIL